MDLLVNKYKPKNIEEVLGNSDTIETLRCIIESRAMPHLLFTGSPGTGKTTCAKIISNTIVKNKSAILELNASDDRGIDVVRTIIKDFTLRVINNVDFKLIILDECDSMTTAAQQAMRRIMEIYSKNCRFILICNDFSKIFEPIQSRCAILKFERIDNSVIMSRLREICENEAIKITDDGLKFIVEASDGDMRQSLNVLQPCINNINVINENYVVHLMGLPSPKLIESIIDSLLGKDQEKALDLFDELWRNKFDAEDIIGTFFRIAKNRDNYDLIKLVGKTHLRIIKGVNSKLVFYGLFYDILNM